MRIVRDESPRAFRDAVESFLLADEARHNLILGLIATLIDQPDVYPEFHLWRIERDGRTVGAALRTLPHNVILAAPDAPGVVEALVDHLVGEGCEVPGVIGGLPEADGFASRYVEATGASISTRTDQAIHVIDEVEDVPVPSGGPRVATLDDRELVLAWQRAFGEEAVPDDRWDEEHARRRLTGRLGASQGSAYRIWEDPGPVCLVVAAAGTKDAVRVGPVYTPPEHRRCGYATALTAHVTREVLAKGVRRCLLYTDLANPTSNAIYARIGYRRVCDSAMILFGPPG